MVVEVLSIAGASNETAGFDTRRGGRVLLSSLGSKGSHSNYRISRVGSPAGFATRLEAFRKGLVEAGYIEGKNVLIEYRWAEGRNDRLAELAADLVGRNVAVIVTPSSANAARAAKSVTQSVPIVFETGLDPIASGLVTSMSHPAGNMTGVSSLNVAVGQ